MILLVNRDVLDMNKINIEPGAIWCVAKVDEINFFGNYSIEYAELNLTTA